MTLESSDVQNRERIENDLEMNFMVEAAAGTGKTTSIVGRMVNLIASGKCKIENIAAATFTRKAAAELRERFHAKLRYEAKRDRSADEIARLNRAVERIEYAFVGTFHSFCSLLLRERPIECGVEPGFREIDETEDMQIRDQAWQLFLNDLYSQQDQRLVRMHDLGLKTIDLKECLDRFVEFPDVQNWPHAAPDPIDLDSFQSEVRSYVEDMRSMSSCFPSARGSDKLMSRYENIVRAADNADWRVHGDFFDLLELFDTTGGATLSGWHDKAIARVEKNRFADFREAIARPALDWWYQHRYQFVVELLEQARGICDRLRKASGGLDFQDLLLRAAAALKTRPGLRSYFQRRFTHLLVDEFQDTDPVQAEILAYLTSSNHDEQNWQRCVPNGGSLFLVGDPKQSIYRFRRADIVTYTQVKGIIERTGGEVLTLSRNFRSNSELLTWVNPVFGTLFGNSESKYSPAAVEMHCGRTEAAIGEMSGVHISRIPADLDQEGAAVYDANVIARYIHNSIAEKKTVSRTEGEMKQGRGPCVEAGDFLIVARNKRYLRVYAEALDRLQIKAEVSGGNAFQDIEELKIVLDCLQAVDDANNPIYYVSVLRGPLFGFSDSDLYELKRMGGRFSYTVPVPDGLSDDLSGRFDHVNSRLLQYRLWLRGMPFTAAFTSIASDLGLLARCCSHEDGSIVAGGFLKAVEWMRAESWNFDSATDMITYLENMLAESETDGCNVMPQRGSSVRIMNLHKVKGLEAPVVFLANTSGAYSREPSFHVDRSDDVVRGYLAITKKKGPYQRQPIAIPSNWTGFKDEESKFEEAEEKRLLYVACTRAACQLVLSVASGSREKYSPWTRLHDHIAGLPELQIPVSDGPINRQQPSPPEMSLAAATQQIDDGWTAVRQPTYEVVSAKSAAMKESGDRPSWRVIGDYGHQWGSAIHALLEIRMNRPAAQFERIASQLAAQYDLGLARVAEMLATVDSVANSDIWSRARKSNNIYTEIPFETASSGPIPIPKITRGVIDLCFEEPAGWVIVDYKTDAIQLDDLPNALIHYRPQLAAYAEFWQDLTGHSIAEMGLFFTKLQSYSPLEP
jgi:ATP-dependent helicase/nuclease subunit A